MRIYFIHDAAENVIFLSILKASNGRRERREFSIPG